MQFTEKNPTKKNSVRETHEKKSLSTTSKGKSIEPLSFHSKKRFVEQSFPLDSEGASKRRVLVTSALPYIYSLPHLGNLVGYYTTDTGELNQIVQLWAYENYADREARRKALWSDPEWTDPSKSTISVMQKQESKILLPTAFSPSHF